MNHLATTLLFFVFLTACQSKNKSTQTTSENSDVEFYEESAEEVTEVEAEDFNVQLYQSAKKTWEIENNVKLPDSIDLKTLYNKTTSLFFGNIVNKTDQYILTHFSNGTDVENNYYATFDLNGRFLDVILYDTRGYGYDFNVDYLAENFISVKHFSQQGFKIDEFGDDTYDHISIHDKYIFVNESGVFKLITTKNEALIITDDDDDDFIFDYYKEKIKKDFPDIKCDVYPFDIIPGDNSSSSTDVYESLEGGGLYAKCLEVRNEKNDLIGVIGYRTDINEDGTPVTFSFVINENQQPIIQYGVVFIDDELHLKVMSLDNVKKNNVDVAINYYNYPLFDSEAGAQIFIHNTFKSNLNNLLK